MILLMKTCVVKKKYADVWDRIKSEIKAINVVIKKIIIEKIT